MTRLLATVAIVAALALAACVDGNQYGCPPGETCTDAHSDGLVFRGEDITGQFGGGPGPIAVGGSQAIELVEFYGNGDPFDLPFRADSTDPSSVRIDAVNGNVVSVYGVADGSSYLRIVDDDGDLYERTLLESASIRQRQARPAARNEQGHEPYDGPAMDEAIVWLPGDHDVTVALWSNPRHGGNGDRLVDHSLQLAMPGATQISWDTIHVPAGPVGHRELLVGGGSGDDALDIETVAAADTIEILDLEAVRLSLYTSTVVCFVARHQGRRVGGAEWSFEMDDGIVTIANAEATKRGGCASFMAGAEHVATIRATASGSRGCSSSRSESGDVIAARRR